MAAIGFLENALVCREPEKKKILGNYSVVYYNGVGEFLKTIFLLTLITI